MKIKHLIILLSVVLFSTTVSASPLATININNSENIIFSDHTSSEHGNWIVLSGGTNVTIPKISINYTGFSLLSYKKNGKTINIKTPPDYGFQYPFETHQMYANNSAVTAIFYNSSEIKGNMDVYLIKTYPTELVNIANKMIDGNTLPFKNLLNKSIRNLTQAADTPISFGNLNSGDYVIIVMLNETNKKNFTIASATTFQVLEYDLTASASPTASKGNFYDISVNLNAPKGNYTYAGLLIRKDDFKTKIKFMSNGTITGTNMSANGEFLVDSFKIAGVGMNKLNKSMMQRIIGEFIDTDYGSIIYKPSGNSTSLSFVTDDLIAGKYLLSVGAWSNSPEKRLVGFYQKEVEIFQKSQSGGTSDGGSSTGGGGVITSEPFENIERHETKYEYLLSGQPVVYSFNPGKNGIYEILLTGQENENDVTLRVEYLKGLSKLVGEPASGKINYYMNIWAATKKIKEVTIRFKLENSWMASNGLTSADIKMLKWDNSKWMQLETLEKSRDDTYSYFEAKSQTLSHFVITGLNENEVPITTMRDSKETETAKELPAPKVSTGLPLNLNLIIYTLFSLMLIVSVLYFLVIKMKVEKK